jgi:hypothetical protein
LAAANLGLHFRWRGDRHRDPNLGNADVSDHLRQNRWRNQPFLIKRGRWHWTVIVVAIVVLWRFGGRGTIIAVRIFSPNGSVASGAGR